ncbi:MAG: amino acid ABC transporter substrate-binding protein [Snowella sp.]|nr:amino acid ABC transporter substrate-binding protein [Snowella sp.]
MKVEKQPFWRIQAFINSLLLFSLTLAPVQAQTTSVIEEIRRTGLLRVAVREDAVPFGYRDLNDNWTGICIDFIEILKNQVIQELNQPIILVKLFKSTLFNRFELVSDQVVYLECGPNTIRQDPPQEIAFSNPIFLTGTQFLIRADDRGRFRSNRSFKGLVIGGLRNTTNLRFVAEKYPQATIQEFQGTTGRLRGVQALQQGKIDAFASDGILLIGEALLQNLSLGREYLIYPKYPLDCEEYGLIIPQDDPQWQRLVNTAIANPATKEVYKKWIGPVFPAVEQTQNYCRQVDGSAVPDDEPDSEQ